MEPLANKIENVLQHEVENTNRIILYNEGNNWCAYERSAYYLASNMSSVTIRKEVVGEGYDVVLLKASYKLDDFTLPLPMGMSLSLMADDLMQLSIDSEIDGFFEWKKQQLEVLPS